MAPTRQCSAMSQLPAREARAAVLLHQSSAGGGGSSGADRNGPRALHTQDPVPRRYDAPRARAAGPDGAAGGAGAAAAARSGSLPASNSPRSSARRRSRIRLICRSGRGRRRYSPGCCELDGKGRWRWPLARRAGVGARRDAGQGLWPGGCGVRPGAGAGFSGREAR